MDEGDVVRVDHRNYVITCLADFGLGNEDGLDMVDATLYDGLDRKHYSLDELYKMGSYIGRFDIETINAINEGIAKEYHASRAHLPKRYTFVEPDASPVTAYEDWCKSHSVSSVREFVGRKMDELLTNPKVQERIKKADEEERKGHRP